MRKPLPDSITVEDQLGRRELLSEVLADIRMSQGPRVIRVHGDWGSGKSSFLFQLEFALSGTSQKALNPVEKKSGEVLYESLKSAPRIPVVYFDAWKHQGDGSPIISILQAIRDQFSPGRKTWEFVKKISTVAIESALVTMDQLTSIINLKLDPKNIREVGEAYEKSKLSTPTLFSSTTALLDKAIQDILNEFGAEFNGGAGDAKIVVLIDELDRCEPEVAKQLLEGLKVFLGLKNCIFVIAMDESVIEEAFMNPEKGENVDSRRKARQYLEKIVQTIYRIPFVSDPAGLLQHYLDPHHRAASVPELCSVLKEHNALPPNPRKIKMLANVLQRQMEKFEAPKITEHFSENPPSSKVVLATAYLLAYLYQFEPKLYRLVSAHDGFLNDELLLSCKEPNYRPGSNHHQLVIGIGKFGEPIYSDPILSAHFWPWKLADVIGSVTDDLLKYLLI